MGKARLYGVLKRGQKQIPGGLKSARNETNKRRALFVLLCALCVLCGEFLKAQPDSKRISFYTAQTSYSLAVVERNNSEYFGLLEALEPMGPVSARIEGNKWKLKFRDIDAQFEASKTNAKIHGKSVQLSAPFFIENSRGLVPVDSIASILPLFGISPVDFHQGSRRVFISAPVVHFSAKQMEPGKIAFSFSAPVNPFIATEAGKLLMVFHREPLLGDKPPIAFDDKLIPSAAYSEANGAAELTISGTAPLSANFSDDRKTITVSAIPAASQQAGPAASGTPASTQQNAGASAKTQAAAPAPRPNPFVIIDAAHGGTDPGAALTPKLAEKDITLALALRLRHELEARGIACALVRDGDTVLTSEQRASIANASKASFYLALHASGTGSGIRIYSSTLTPATHAPLAFVPVEMAQASEIARSRATASAMVDALLKRDIPAASLPAALAPLNSLDIPAIAIEVGPPEAGAEGLSSASFQQSTAAALGAGVAAAQTRMAREVSR